MPEIIINYKNHNDEFESVEITGDSFNEVKDAGDGGWAFPIGENKIRYIPSHRILDVIYDANE